MAPMDSEQAAAPDLREELPEGPNIGTAGGVPEVDDRLGAVRLEEKDVIAIDDFPHAVLEVEDEAVRGVVGHDDRPRSLDN